MSSTTIPKPAPNKDNPRWTPIRKGKLLCSPACGGQCTYAAYVRAHKEAAACLRALGGSGWRIRVWENLGWHWQVNRGAMQVRGYGEGYMVTTQIAGTCLSTERYYKSPRKGVLQVLKLAREIVHEAVDQLRVQEGGR